MLRMWIVIVAALALHMPPSAFSAGPPGAPESVKKQNPYTITVIPYYSPEKIWARFAPFVEYLKKATGLPWELKLYPNHDAVLQALCSGDVSLALLGPVPLGRAIEACDAGIVAVTVNRDGKPRYHALIITNDPAVTSLAALRHRRFGLFKGSTAAHVMPLAMLRSAGLTEKDIDPVFYESQDRIIDALLSREVAGAGVKDVLYRKFSDAPLRVLATSEPLPNFAFAAAPLLDERTKKRFADALVRLRPQMSADDQALTRDWDDEIKNGFMLPPADFRASVLRLRGLTGEFLHADR